MGPPNNGVTEDGFSNDGAVDGGVANDGAADDVRWKWYALATIQQPTHLTRNTMAAAGACIVWVVSGVVDRGVLRA